MPGGMFVSSSGGLPTSMLPITYSQTIGANQIAIIPLKAANPTGIIQGKVAAIYNGYRHWISFSITHYSGNMLGWIYDYALFRQDGSYLEDFFDFSTYNMDVLILPRLSSFLNGEGKVCFALRNLLNENIFITVEA